jgi:hypothetical protein
MFCKNAPHALINVVQHPNPFIGRFILYRLLTDPTMDEAWREIEKRLFRDWKRRLDEAARYAHRAEWYPRIWKEIYYAFLRSNADPPSRRAKRDHFNSIAKITRDLAGKIASGPLDRLSYEFFPIDKAEIAFRAPKWSGLGSDERRRIADRKMKQWPSLTDLLEEVIRDADRYAKEADD